MVGVDKATVHEALNHADSDMKVTDIYIDRDWSTIWNANEKVLALFDWSAIGYDLLSLTFVKTKIIIAFSTLASGCQL